MGLSFRRVSEVHIGATGAGISEAKERGSVGDGKRRERQHPIVAHREASRRSVKWVTKSFFLIPFRKVNMVTGL